MRYICDIIEHTFLLDKDKLMATNSNLQMSRAGKTDEFYTQLSTIEDELWHYRKYFEGKTVFCNADDPAIGEDGLDHLGDDLGGYTSNFFRYFQLNFNRLGLKRLITTHYVSEGQSYKFEIVSQDNGAQIAFPEYVKTPLNGNGDFRSGECVALLKECDIVVTNPPFSLMKEYLPLLINSGKEFIVLGNVNHITLSEIKPYVLQEKVWLGYNSGHFWFKVPDYYEAKNTDYKQDEGGQKWRRMGNSCWFTNIDIDKRHIPLDLFKHYSSREYLKYDDYDAIECSITKYIPDDYFGVIGVPVTYLPYHCSEQFEILEIVTPKIEGKSKYKRLLIKRKQ